MKRIIKAAAILVLVIFNLNIVLVSAKEEANGSFECEKIQFDFEKYEEYKKMQTLNLEYITPIPNTNSDSMFYSSPDYLDKECRYN